MIIRLDTVRSEPIDWTESLPLTTSDLGLGEDSELTPIEVTGRIERADPDLLLTARLRFRVVTPCDRCTAPAAAEVEAGFELILEPGRGGAVEGPGERQVQEEELGVLELPGWDLDTRPIVAEQAQLELPTRPLCREACRGLCPVCGVDRNVVDCDCDTRGVDPRWSALEKLGRK